VEKDRQSELNIEVNLPIHEKIAPYRHLQTYQLCKRTVSPIEPQICPVIAAALFLENGTNARKVPANQKDEVLPSN
jgi:hypothetical protein